MGYRFGKRSKKSKLDLKWNDRITISQRPKYYYLSKEIEQQQFLSESTTEDFLHVIRMIGFVHHSNSYFPPMLVCVHQTDFEFHSCVKQNRIDSSKLKDG